MNLNSKLRRRGNISAYEINSARDQNTGEKLNLDDATLRANQLKTRSIQQDDSIKVEPILVGDTVSVKNKTDKHKANEMYIAVGKDSPSSRENAHKGNEQSLPNRLKKVKNDSQT